MPGGVKLWDTKKDRPFEKTPKIHPPSSLSSMRELHRISQSSEEDAERNFGDDVGIASELVDADGGAAACLL